MKNVYRQWLLAGIGALVFALSACAPGDKGDQGQTGATGKSGQSTQISVIQQTVSFTILSASVPTSDYKPVVTFRLQDQDGLSYSKLTLGPNLSSANLRMTIAKLVAATATEPAYWQNFLNGTQTKNSTAPGVWTGPTVSSRTETQPSQEGSFSFPAGTLTYDSSSGIYTYKFNTAINNIVSPIAVAYSPTDTMRIGAELRNINDSSGAVMGADIVYDFVPAGGTPTSRQVVATSTCNGACHTKLAVHGEGRFTTDYCLMCHNANNRDPNGGDPYDMTKGNPLDLKILVHRLHMGRNLPTKIDGNIDYSIWGYQDAIASFASGTFPVMTTSRSTNTTSTGNNLAGDYLYLRTTAAVGGSFFPDCVKCHVEGTGAPAQATNWRTNASIQACTSCHNNVAFDGSAPTGPTNGPTSMSGKWVNHQGGTQANNAACNGCHNSGQPGDTQAAHAYAVNVRAQADRWTYNITTVSYNSTSGALDVTYRIDETVSGTTTQGIDYRARQEFQTCYVASAAASTTCLTSSSGNQAVAAGSLNIKVAWPAWEYVNDGQNSANQFDNTGILGNGGTNVAANVNGPTPPMIYALSMGQSAPGSALSQSVTQTLPAANVANPNSNAPSAPNGSCPGLTCTFTKTVYLPASAVNAYGAVTNRVTLAVYLDGHPIGQIQSGIGNNGVTAASSSGHGSIEPRWRSVPAQSTLTYWEVATNTTGAGTKLDPASAANVDKVRRQVVETNRCQNCHTTLTLHGNNRSDDTQVCVTCHNPSNTDLGNRAAANSVDGQLQQAIDMKVMIHGIHAGGKLSWDPANTKTYTGFRDKGLIVAGNNGSLNDFVATVFPNRLDNCQACHKEGTYELPLSSLVNPTTWSTVPAVTTRWESQRHSFSTAAVTNAGGIQITLTGSAGQSYSTANLPVRLYTSGDARLPTGLSAGVTYFIINPAGTTTNTFNLSTSSGGGAIPFTDAGNIGTQTGSSYFTILAADYSDAADNLRMTPVAAACTGCHNDGIAKTHVVATGLGVLDKDYSLAVPTPTSMTLSTYKTSQSNGFGTGLELCELCHGSGGIVDIEKVHRIGTP